MTTHGYPQHVHKKRSFLSTLAWGFSVMLITVIMCATLIGVYGMNIVDRKTDTLTGFVQEAVRSLPEMVDSLPPAVADVLDDQRLPGYAETIDVSVRLVPVGRRDWVRPVIEVHNRGGEMVSLLSMRVVVFDEDGDPVGEMNEWGATPIAADDEWRGPLMPGAKRHILSRYLHLNDGRSSEELRADVEITDIRVWKGEATQLDAAADETPAEQAIAQASD